MATDPPDRSAPPDPNGWGAEDPPEPPPSPSFVRPKPRPLHADRDAVTITHVERVPRPEPVARIGARPPDPPPDVPRPEPVARIGPPADGTPDTPAPRAAWSGPGADWLRPRAEPAREPERARPEPERLSRPEERPFRPEPAPRADDRPFRGEPERPHRAEPPPRLDAERPAWADRGVLPREQTDELPLPAPSRPAALRLDANAAPPQEPRPSAAMELPDQPRWQPREPRTWEEAGLDPVLGEQLVLRYLTTVSTESARQVANDLCLALPMVKELLEQLKTAKLVQHRGSTAMGDFIYELTDAGRSKAIDYKRLCAYVGPAPVPWARYLQSVRDQALRSRSPTPYDLAAAFDDLLVSADLIDRLGPAITSGRAMFLHGDPGNGKTSIAERITRCFGDEIWIPHALLIDGHLVKLYDPATHEAVDPAFKPLTPSERLDRRWVKVRRPTVVAGGELTLEMLEIQLDPLTNIGEAPLQLKANCGTLVIDDFGRQRIEPQVLLNRWIFPLERRIDFLRLPDGRKISSPFDPLLIFSTNLEPKQLVDEAFLRRIPYKIQVVDPTEEEFVALVEIVAARMDVMLAPGAVDALVDRHYRKAGRHFRFCHPRDLLFQVVNQCAYERRPRIATAVEFDRAVANYFGAL